VSREYLSRLPAVQPGHASRRMVRKVME
jgi:hypothetical protein